MKNISKPSWHYKANERSIFNYFANFKIPINILARDCLPSTQAKQDLIISPVVKFAIDLNKRVDTQEKVDFYSSNDIEISSSDLHAQYRDFYEMSGFRGKEGSTSIQYMWDELRKLGIKSITRRPTVYVGDKKTRPQVTYASYNYRQLEKKIGEMLTNPKFRFYTPGDQNENIPQTSVVTPFNKLDYTLPTEVKENIYEKNIIADKDREIQMLKEAQAVTQKQIEEQAKQIEEQRKQIQLLMQLLQQKST